MVCTRRGGKTLRLLRAESAAASLPRFVRRRSRKTGSAQRPRKPLSPFSSAAPAREPAAPVRESAAMLPIHMPCGGLPAAKPRARARKKSPLQNVMRGYQLCFSERCYFFTQHSALYFKAVVVLLLCQYCKLA